MSDKKHRIVLGGNGWTLDAHGVREGDRVEILVDGLWRKAVVWFREGSPFVVQRFGQAGSDVVIGIPPDKLAIRWPGDVAPVRALPN